MSVDVDAPSGSTPVVTPAVPALSAAAVKKEEEAKAERERKYPASRHRAGIVLAGEKKVSSKLLEKDLGSREKIFLVNGCVSIYSSSMDLSLTRWF